MKNIKLTVMALLLFVGISRGQTSQSDFAFSEPVDVTQLTKLTLWSTQYYVHKFNSGGKIPIVLSNGKSAGLYADTCNFCAATLEGTAYVTDSAGKVAVINYAKIGDKTFVDCRKCKKYSKSKLAVESWGKTLWMKSAGFGDGVRNFKLIPFRTIAVDKNKIAYGSVIFIPSVKGQKIELPNGQKVVHDGYFFAGDTGGAIKGNHIDTFTGIYASNPLPGTIKSNPKKTFEVFMVTDQNIIAQLTKIQTK
jgi:3D (Asp-Asp-Asp) domain-containing protein